MEHNGLWVYSERLCVGHPADGWRLYFTRPSVHQRSEALKELCDGLGVFKRGTQWATIQDSVGSPSETGSGHLHVIAEEISRVVVLCIGQDMGTMNAATAFMNMGAGSVN
ncbi:MAG TPA: hypothetical protein VGH37_19070 [Candidatus Acidoferrum sp.]